MVKAREAFELLRELPEMKLGHVLQEIGGILPGHRFASVRAGVEMAMIDAVAKSVGVPLWKLFVWGFEYNHHRYYSSVLTF
ncbi:hypothetical protein Bca52824_073845 [Brassica carinata]|uniref:Uncharacterized protein n=1 Tax=Brassica carinata TaxID=52824 RepID=A0A8X7U8D5_BRACI|nr:hypothetical protein Bca52824_073845 [Brassica carinata]